MKIEKVNDHQIRCTLTKADLADRELKISELAYGTEKAKNLFRDMMQQASYEFGFDADDIPLMIEAIPLNSECIVLVITKVEDPEELDTRFSKFAPSVHDEYEEEDLGNTLDSMLQSLSEGADDVLDLFKKIHDGHLAEATAETLNGAEKSKLKSPATAKQAAGIDLTRIYGFESLNQVTRLAHILAQHYNGKNSLYKNEKILWLSAGCNTVRPHPGGVQQDLQHALRVWKSRETCLSERSLYGRTFRTCHQGQSSSGIVPCITNTA